MRTISVVKHLVSSPTLQPNLNPVANTGSHKCVTAVRAYMCSCAHSVWMKASESGGKGIWICTAVISEGRGSEHSLLDSQLEQIVLVLMCSTINNVWKQRRPPFSHYCTCITSPTDSRLSCATHTHTHTALQKINEVPTIMLFLNNPDVYEQNIVKCTQTVNCQREIDVKTN